MKNRITFLLLWCFLLPGIASAQEDTIPDLVISEQGGTWPINWEYFELTNMGDTALNMNDFVWQTRDQPWYNPQLIFRLAEEDWWLEPDSSYVVGQVYDLGDKYYPKLGVGTHPDIKKEIDREGHRREYWDWMIEAYPEIDPEEDSVNAISEGILLWQNGWSYKLWYGKGKDSVLIDQIAWYPDGVDKPDDFHAVAGVPEAYTKSQLFRKTTITEGNTDWDDSRGVSHETSEWIPVPDPYNGANRHRGRYFTTVGRHGEGYLDEEHVNSDNFEIDFDNATMTIPWGIYGDSMMNREYINLGDNLAWHYFYSSGREDSIHNIVRTNDTLSMYALGAELEQIDFVLEQGPPTEETEALVFPLNYHTNSGIPSTWGPYEVTQNEPVIDSVLWLGFAERVDTLWKYLEKAPNAEWDIVWVDGNERADLKWGDKLEVTAESGATKEYFLAVDTVPAMSSNAFLNAITWPDAPKHLRQNPDWHDDTIPNFSSQGYQYTLKIPAGTETVPALKALPQNLNTQVSVDRATRLDGPVDERTTTFTVVAEDDTTVNEYKVTFEQDLAPGELQPFETEPVISEIVFASAGNHVEIVNPGNQPLDLSNYMLVFGTDGDGSPADVIQNGFTFDNAYKRYVFGYRYTNLEAVWESHPGVLEQDLRVEPVIDGGETFVFGEPRNLWRFGDVVNDIADRANVILGDDYDTLDTETPIIRPDLLRSTNRDNRFGSLYWYNYKICLFKIKNDSIKEGTKGVHDPADFELIDMFGDWRSGAEGNWSATEDTIDFWNSHMSYKRKPEIWQPNPKAGVEGSWGLTDEDSEWTMLLSAEYQKEHPSAGWQWVESVLIPSNLSLHAMDPVTVFSSTVTSKVYKVSEGYKTPQTIEGVVTGTSVADFKANLEKRHADQALEVIGSGGNVANEDTLKVTSADSSNVTKYVLSVSDEGLSDDAVLTAVDGSGYDISYDDDEGAIDSIPFGSTIKEVIENVIKPENAKLNVLERIVFDTSGVENVSYARAPLQVKNFDTVYVDTRASEDIFFEVVAEDMQTTITYQLQTDVAEDEVYAWSNEYEVDQTLQDVTLIPTGTNVETLLKYLRPTTGASIKVVDKIGIEREWGDVKWDDQALVTSADGSTEKYYALTFKGEGRGGDAYVVSEVLGVDQIDSDIWGLQDNVNVSIFKGLVTPAPEAILEVLDDEGNPYTTGEIGKDFDLKVTSGDSSVVKVYDLYFSEEEPGTGAYLTSDSLTVNDADPSVSGIHPDMTVEEFVGLVEPAPKAEMTVMDADGNVVESGDLDEDYTVQVVSGDGDKEVVYSMEFIPVGIESIEGAGGLSIYPNPVKDNLHVKGISDDSRLVIRNIFGMTVKMVDGEDVRRKGSLSVQDLPDGIYFINERSGDTQSEPVRFIKQ